MATIRKRGETFQIRVSSGYYDMLGRQITKTTTFKPALGMTDKQIEKELNRVATKFEQVVTNGDYNSNGNMRLSEFYPQYLGFIKNSIAPTTYVTYQRIIKNFILPNIGNMKLKDIKPIHIQRFIQTVGDIKITKKGEQVNYTPATIRRYYVVLQSIMSRTCKLGLINTNPADSSKIDLPALDNQDIEIFTKEQVSFMLDCLDNEELMYQVLIHRAINTGCRRGELVALKWDCVSMDNGTITIKRSNYKLTGEGIQSKEPKSKGSIRSIAIPQYCIALMAEYKQWQDEQAKALGDQWVFDNWVFTQWNGEPMHPHTPTHWFSKFLAKYKLPHRKFHSLRHTSATLLLAGGVNIKTVASRLGHAQLSTTNIYLHSVTDADTASAELLGDILTKRKEQVM